MQKRFDNTEQGIERRYLPLGELRVDKGGDGKPEKIEGYAAVFNSMSEELWGFREKIDQGAFAETIKADDVRALFNHDPNFVLGRNRSGTLQLKEDTKGLLYSAKPPETDWARDLMTSIDRGDINQSSFGFQVITDTWETIEEENIRTLIKVRLFDVSPVTFPAYQDSEVWTRDINSIMERACAGFDYAQVMRALIRLERSLPLLDGDQDIIQKFTELINTKRSGSAAGSAIPIENVEEPAGREIGILKKRIHLARQKRGDF